jgi:tRNA nucleotidyltransferase (CCA-adding enzyme)
LTPLERDAWAVVEKLERAGYEAYLVGGCVRDMWLGREVYDYDITTSALPEEVQSLFPHTVPTGIKHGTVSVLTEHGRYEVTTFRADLEYKDGRRPEEVVFVRSLKEDLARRDFTVNAMALGRDGTLHDPFGGREDLEKKVIRAVGDPVRRFEEDALRMLRAIRFAAQLGFSIEPRTLQAIADESQSLQRISRERIRDEWEKMLLSAPDVAIPLLQKTHALRYVLSRPQTFDLRVNDPWGLGVDPWQLAGEWAARAPRDFAVRLVTVLLAVRTDEARMERTVQELKLSGEQKRKIRGAWQMKAYGDPRRWSDEQWRQVFYKHGYETVKRGVQVFAALEEGWRRTASIKSVEGERTRKSEAHAGSADGDCTDWEQLVEEHAARQPIWSLQDLAVSGQDLLDAGVPAGPELGLALQRLAEAVLREPKLNRRENLLRLSPLVDGGCD